MNYTMSRTMNRISRIFKAFLSLSLCFLLFALSACGQVQTETPEAPDTPDSQSTPEDVISVPETPETPETIVTPNEDEAPEEPEDDPALVQLSESTGIPLATLKKRIAFSQSISFTLPEGMTLGEYDAMLNYCGGGGVPLLKDEESCGQLELRYPEELNLKWNDDGSLAYIISVDNHAMFLEDFIALDTQQPGIYAEYSQDNAASESGEDRFWYAFWGQQYGEIIYCLKVNAESMDRDAFIALANSAVFADGAFHG